MNGSTAPESDSLAVLCSVCMGRDFFLWCHEGCAQDTYEDHRLHHHPDTPALSEPQLKAGSEWLLAVDELFLMEALQPKNPHVALNVEE